MMQIGQQDRECTKRRICVALCEQKHLARHHDARNSHNRYRPKDTFNWKNWATILAGRFSQIRTARKVEHDFAG